MFQSSVQARLEREPLVAEVNSDDPLPHEPAHSSVDEAISPLRALKIPVRKVILHVCGSYHCHCFLYPKA